MRKHKIHLSLRGRFTLLISAVFIVTFALIAFFLVRDTEQSSIRDLNEASKAFASLATSPIGDTYGVYMNSGSIRINQQVQSFMNLDSDISNVGVISLSGSTQFSINSQPKFQNTKTDSFNAQYTYNKSGLITQILEPYFDASGQHPYSIAFAVTDAGLNHDVSTSVAFIIIFSVIGLVASAVAMYEITTRLFISPIERMSRQATLVSQGRYDQTVEVKSQDEIGDLARSVNSMSNSLKADIAELQQLDQMKNQFITITSHNLRTPLTIIKGNVELLNSSDLPPATSNSIRQISESAKALSDFAEDMLTISSIEADRTVIDMQQISIADLTTSVHQVFAILAAQKGIALNWNVPDPKAIVVVSVIHMQSVLRNLLDNAMKFTDRGGHIDVSITLQNLTFTISVSDNGAGIDPEEQPKVFEKFHRGKNAQELDYSAGTGIGLYVTRLIVEAHKGKITLHSEKGKGTTLVANIPQPAISGQTPPPADKPILDDFNPIAL